MQFVVEGLGVVVDDDGYCVTPLVVHTTCVGARPDRLTETGWLVVVKVLLFRVQERERGQREKAEAAGARMSENWEGGGWDRQREGGREAGGTGRGRESEGVDG
jgi:hypothetical protein